MNILKPTLISLVLSSFIVPSIVSADDNWVDIYGKIMLTLDHVDEDNADEQWELNSNATRFGVKGFGDSGIDGVEAFYTMEWAVDITDESNEKNIKSRNQYVGLRGDFGEVLAGRKDTPTKVMGKRVELFNDYQMEFKTSFNGEKRVNNIIQYTTPKMGGLKAVIALVPGETTGNNDGLADGTSIMVEYKAGDFIFGVSVDDGIEGENVELTRAVAQYSKGNWKAGLMYQDTDNNGISADGLVVSTSYKMDKHTLKLQLVESDAWEAGVSSKVKYQSQQILGWDYKAGKKTTFVSYLSFSEDGGSGDKDTVFGLGIVQKF